VNPLAYLEMASFESRHWWFVGRRRILESLLSSLALQQGAKVLEIGCGTGGNLRMLSKFGAVSAMEMDVIAIDIAKEKAGDICDIRQGYGPDGFPIFATKFDLICMFDVLEHIEKDVETLAAIKKLLNPGGCVVITVPAFQWLYGTHDEFLHHKRRYSADQIRKVAASSGLAIRRISYFNTLLFPFAVLARLKDRLFPGKQATGAGMPPALVNTAFKSIFGFELNLLKHINLPFGVSLLCVLHTRE
jgi:SAM-dependent methyltransferase